MVSSTTKWSMCFSGINMHDTILNRQTINQEFGWISSTVKPSGLDRITSHQSVKLLDHPTFRVQGVFQLDPILLHRWWQVSALLKSRPICPVFSQPFLGWFNAKKRSLEASKVQLKDGCPMKTMAWWTESGCKEIRWPKSKGCWEMIAWKIMEG